MFRRVVCLVLLPTVLLTQWASAGRCHGGCQTGHDRTPHVHLRGQPFTETKLHTAHSHHACNGHSHDDDPEDVQEFTIRQGSTEPGGEDVLYLPTALISGWLTGRSSTGAADDVVCTPPLYVSSFVLVCAPSPAALVPPDPLLPVWGYPTYLRVLTLLI